MLSSVLNSKRAVQTNILIVRIFMKMRKLLENNKELAERVAKLEVSTKRHASVLVILVNDIRNRPTRRSNLTSRRSRSDSM